MMATYDLLITKKDMRNLKEIELQKMLGEIKKGVSKKKK